MEIPNISWDFDIPCFYHNTFLCNFQDLISDRESKHFTADHPQLGVGFNSAEPYMSSNRIVPSSVMVQSPLVLLGSSSLESTQLNLTSGDLVLPSCGLVSMPKESHKHRSSQSPPPLLTPELPRRAGIGGDSELKTPCSGSPISQPSSPEQPAGSKMGSGEDHVSGIQRHRHSLPTPSLGLSLGMSITKKRSVTPEIKITEEPYADCSHLLPPSSLTCKRISRSSEDLIAMSGSDPTSVALRLKSAGGSSQLQPISSEAIRSTSDQDICGSLGNQMKGSHSDNAIIRSNNPFQRFTQQASGNPPFKKELVLVPLGKLARGMQSLGANYLHPKKLRDTFKPQLKREPELLKPEDLEELRILEEKKRNCKSLIVDL